MELNEAMNLVLELAEMNAITDYQAGDSDDLIMERNRQQDAFETFRLHLAELEAPSPVQCIISVGGGLIVGVITNVPTDCTVIDEDIEGASDADITTLTTMGNLECYVSRPTADCDPAYAAAVLGEIDSKKA